MGQHTVWPGWTRVSWHSAHPYGWSLESRRTPCQIQHDDLHSISAEDDAPSRPLRYDVIESEFGLWSYEEEGEAATLTAMGKYVPKTQVPRNLTTNQYVFEKRLPSGISLGHIVLMRISWSSDSSTSIAGGISGQGRLGWPWRRHCRCRHAGEYERRMAGCHRWHPWWGTGSAVERFRRRLGNRMESLILHEQEAMKSLDVKDIWGYNPRLQMYGWMDGRMILFTLTPRFWRYTGYSNYMSLNVHV